MIVWLLAIVFFSLVLGVVKHRIGTKDRRAGLDPNAPQQVQIQTDDPTGPRQWLRHSDGNL